MPRHATAYGHTASGVGEYVFNYNNNGTLDFVDMPSLSATEQYVFGQNGQLERITDGTDPLWTYTWGSDGQMCTREQTGEGRSELFWSADGRLTRIGTRDGTEHFAYDSGGSKMAYIDLRGRTTLFLDGVELNTDTGEKVQPFEMPSVRCELRDGAPDPGQCFWYDYMNVALVSNLDTGYLSTVHYSPFGRKHVSQGDGPRFAFNGQEEVGHARQLLNYGFRHYDPDARIFLSADPLAMGGMPPGLTTAMHSYSYAAQNPTSMMDILGLTPEKYPPWKTPDTATPDAGVGDMGVPGPASLPPVQSPLDAGGVAHPMALPSGPISGDVTTADVSFASCAAGPELCPRVEGFHYKEAEWHAIHTAGPILGPYVVAAVVRLAQSAMGLVAPLAPVVGVGTRLAARYGDKAQSLGAAAYGYGWTPAGRALTEHAMESLPRHGFNMNNLALVDRIINNAGWRIAQADGAIVHLMRAGRRAYHFVVEGEHGIVTGMLNQSMRQLSAFADRYGWAGWP